ncbi:helix-hairpin-helix domain-containing protein [Geomicrobium sp. JCM 19055]|uniref:helix-hairpin-helix domain-containing protein n=1 Tax=Geomicrobium sp. JCM 19055 TaxID=1460649 RepID=UPI00045ED6A1|nr:helix-hairpin-helix domain-containing protein [Geomicrobium sp. JCM 19055]GAJ99079.1 late competence protein ComEA, DNA receptor [Geomicrobium sp. JCM 19055]
MISFERLKENWKWFVATPIVIGLIGSVLLWQFLSEPAVQSNDEEMLFTSLEQIEGKEELEPEEDLVLPTTLFVDVKGEVRKPGVYELQHDDRIVDAIYIAGGLSENGSDLAINYAQKLVDEMVIYVPHIDDDLEQGEIWEANVGQAEESTRVNLNQSNELELQTLPGIGPSKAAAIISYREENGPFQTIEELTNVPGFGSKTFTNLELLIEV